MQKLPPGWTDTRIQDVIKSYSAQSEDEQAEEIEAALNASNTTIMSVPTELVDEVRTLIAKSQASNNAAPTS